MSITNRLSEFLLFTNYSLFGLFKKLDLNGQWLFCGTLLIESKSIDKCYDKGGTIYYKIIYSVLHKIVPSLACVGLGWRVLAVGM
jgi:hypothetical protein